MKKGQTLTANWSCNKLNEAKFAKFKEEILKKDGQLRNMVINMRESHLKKDQLDELQQEIEKLKVSDTFHLNLICCKIENYPSLTSIISSQNQANQIKLELGSINMFDNQIEYICDGLKNSNTSKLMLHISGNTIQDQGMQMVANTIYSMNSLVQLNLDISRNKLGSESGIDLANGLKQCKNLEKLCINFAANFIYTTKILANAFHSISDMPKLIDLNIKTVSSSARLDINTFGSCKIAYEKLFLTLSAAKQLRSLKLNLEENVLTIVGIPNAISKLILSLEQLKVFELPNCMYDQDNLTVLANNLNKHKNLNFIFLNTNKEVKTISKYKNIYKTKRLVYLK